MRNRYVDSYNFWPSYGDLALTAVLILLLFLLTTNVATSRALLEQNIDGLRVESRQEIVRSSLEGVQGIDTIEVDGNTQIITLSGDLVFLSDSTDLKPEGKALLQNLAGILDANERDFTRIVVEGHADAQDSRAFYRAGDNPDDHGNWRLSAERAIRVVQLFQQAGIDGSKLEVSGRSKYGPRDGDFLQWQELDAPELIPEYQRSLRKNRRIVIRLFYSKHVSSAQ